jgi:hypothetical protein
LNEVESETGIGSERREMAHFSSRARGEFSVEMQLHVGMREGG